MRVKARRAEALRTRGEDSAGLGWILLFSLLLGQAVSWTLEIHYSGNILAGPAENYISLRWISVLRGLGFSLPAAALCLLLSRLSRFRFSGGAAVPKLSFRAFFFLVWGILLVSWLPYLVSFYPGGVVGDGAEALEYALDPSRIDTRWGAAFILVLRVFLALGRLFSPDVNTGIFLYTLWSVLLYSAACAYTVSFLRRRGLPPAAQILCVFLYAAFGHYASYAMALWKDGLFAAGLTLLSLMLWAEPREGLPRRSWSVRTGLLLAFLCLWRSAVSWAVAGAGLLVLLLSKGKRKNLACLLLAVGLLMILITGPGYALLGFTGTGAAEAIALPLQQTAAALSEGAELNEWQRSVLFSLLPEKEWTARYTPALADSLKNHIDDAVMREKMGDFLRVWLQLMPAHLGTYLKAHLLETLGFWQVYGGNQGFYFDWFLGVQDLYGRGYVSRDLLYEHTAYTLAPSLTRRAAFIPCGTLGWVLLLSFTLVLGQRKERRKKAAVLAPFLVCWVSVLFVAPIAYSYRYVESLAAGLPVIALLPWMRTEDPAGLAGAALSARESIPDGSARGKWACRLLAAAAVLSALLLLLTGLRQMNRFTDGKLVIPVCGEADDSGYFVVRGLYPDEGTYRWTEGTELEVRIPYREPQKELRVSIHVIGVFTGVQPYQVTDENGALLAEGSMNSPGDLSFPLRAGEQEIAFTLHMPEAAVIAEVVPGAGDPRRVAFQVDRIVVEQVSP